MIPTILIATLMAVPGWQGTVRWEPDKQGNPTLVAYGRASYFGPGLYGNRCHSGIRLQPDTVGCALPRGKCRLTRPTPFDDVPDNAKVRIHWQGSQKTVVVRCIDEGPATHTGYMVDLTGPVLDRLYCPRRRNPMVNIRIWLEADDDADTG